MTTFEQQFDELQRMARGEDTTAGAVRQTMEGERIKAERLDELRERVFFDYQEWDIKCSKDGFQEASPTGEMDADGKDLTALIDAEITRQSVTDEAVRRAIEWAEQERKNSFRYMDFGDADSAALAITALRQMKPSK